MRLQSYQTRIQGGEIEMWIPKWFWDNQAKKIDEMERRVKRLELILMKDAESKIASLRDETAGSVSSDGILTIEEIINK